MLEKRRVRIARSLRTKMQKARFPHDGHALRSYDRSNGSFVEKVPDTFDLRYPAKQSFSHLPAYTASSKRYRIRSIFAIQQSEASRTFSSHCMYWPPQRSCQHECGQTQEVEVPRSPPGRTKHGFQAPPHNDVRRRRRRDDSIIRETWQLSVLSEEAKGTPSEEIGQCVVPWFAQHQSR